MMRRLILVHMIFYVMPMYIGIFLPIPIFYVGTRGQQPIYIYKPRGALPLEQFLLVGPLFLCVEKVRGRK